MGVGNAVKNQCMYLTRRGLLLEGSVVNIITKGFLVAENLNEYISSVFTDGL